MCCKLELAPEEMRVPCGALIHREAPDLRESMLTSLPDLLLEERLGKGTDGTQCPWNGII